MLDKPNTRGSSRNIRRTSAPHTETLPRSGLCTRAKCMWPSMRLSASADALLITEDRRTTRDRERKCAREVDEGHRDLILAPLILEVGPYLQLLVNLLLDRSAHLRRVDSHYSRARSVRWTAPYPRGLLPLLLASATRHATAAADIGQAPHRCRDPLAASHSSRRRRRRLFMAHSLPARETTARN